MTLPDYLRDFVLPTPPAEPVDAGGFDLYLPATEHGPAPLTVLVHGGPLREAPSRPPRQWPVFGGYAAALAVRGVAAAVFDHELLRSLDYAGAAARLADVLAAGRAHPGIDGDRVAVWYFSGGGPLAAVLLADPPAWLRTVALSYPMLQPLGAIEGFRPTAELTAAGRLPVLLTRAEHEFPELAVAQEEFVATARSGNTDLTVIEVAGGHHAFDVLDDTDGSRTALEQALEFVRARLA